MRTVRKRTHRAVVACDSCRMRKVKVRITPCPILFPSELTGCAAFSVMGSLPVLAAFVSFSAMLRTFNMRLTGPELRALLYMFFQNTPVCETQPS